MRKTHSGYNMPNPALYFRLPIDHPLFTVGLRSSYFLNTMKLRRRVVGAADAEAEAEESSSSATLSISLPPELDLEYLAQAIPEVENWTNPTAAAILELYAAFITSAKTRDSLQE